jgi:crossover junction endodeoxyribonuclease RusA
VNHYKSIGKLQTTKSGKIYQQRFNSVETKRYFYEVYFKLRQGAAFKSFGDARLSVSIDVYPRDKRKRDLDGILKVLLDSLQHGGLYNDDSQIDRLLVERCEVVENGKVIVKIKEF